jgi:hypothetical protein
MGSAAYCNEALHPHIGFGRPSPAPDTLPPPPTPHAPRVSAPAPTHVPKQRLPLFLMPPIPPLAGKQLSGQKPAQTLNMNKFPQMYSALNHSSCCSSSSTAYTRVQLAPSSAPGGAWWCLRPPSVRNAHLLVYHFVDTLSSGPLPTFTHCSCGSKCLVTLSKPCSAEPPPPLPPPPPLCPCSLLSMLAVVCSKLAHTAPLAMSTYHSKQARMLPPPTPCLPPLPPPFTINFHLSIMLKLPSAQRHTCTLSPLSPQLCVLRTSHD